MTPSSRYCNVCGTDNPSQAAFRMTCGGPMEGEIPLPSNATGLMQQDQLSNSAIVSLRKLDEAASQRSIRQKTCTSIRAWLLSRR